MRPDRPPDRIIVAADNCTDATVELAAAEGVEVYETVDNSHKKAGALNQVLEQMLVPMNPSDGVLIMDADTVMAPRSSRCGVPSRREPRGRRRD